VSLQTTVVMIVNLPYTHLANSLQVPYTCAIVLPFGAV
jgi:hypothetical protein